MDEKMDNFTEVLDWDTNFFGRKIAKVVVCDSDERYVEEKLSQYKALDFDLVYIFLPGDFVLSEILCSSYNCRLVDCKLIYNTYVEEEYEVSPQVVEYKGEALPLYDLGLQSGIHSRYRMDPYFAEDDFQRLYKRWIDNSVQYLIADKIFVFDGGQGIKGFVTVKIQDEDASIGLIATDSKQRGRGVGSQLLAAVKKYVKDIGGRHLSVATQKGNGLACSFYEKNGFSLKSETNIYHAWLMK